MSLGCSKILSALLVCTFLASTVDSFQLGSLRPSLRLPSPSRCAARRSTSLRMQQDNFFSKFARTIVEKAKADVDRIDRLFRGLESVRSDMSVIDELLAYWNLDETDQTLEKLEEALIMRDFGVSTSAKICEGLMTSVRNGSIKNYKEIRQAMKDTIVTILESGGNPALILDDQKPAVVLMVGVNGGGKTTTVGKIATKLAEEGKTVMLAAGDTFRAAADLQLEEWAKRSNAILAPTSNPKSPAAVMYDAIDASVSQEVDVLIADTSGRLHTNTNLMKELEKVRGVFEKKMPGKPKEILLVVDATQGQNVLNQARGFNKAVGVTGIVLTKLDGTSKGGVVVSIVDELKIPVKLIGVGEKAKDLMLFDAREYVEALFPN
ncbi:hypothetical protein GUITHDRAFT_86810 [Guillardia theta CCMP2712]|uniref:SRP54-type proteins GTP-binding domain-containing protein n=1 Tax=Guillardia theta (strain CCMP2712) TaxID=905079 RepID=L1JCZ1_GUITC|nr:hypothetical protein GUITHDRAFT_86810 [Guillardia theta CCMP2712]EKX46371.1 hypothetical protein GUITHDRAFT_86810 [Guillardia theta CCMP2712]|eukprot:XP_005833351.1 hypothetical protein GUITHDRAFT_86810 [Guillardia theta CCMP2712]